MTQEFEGKTALVTGGGTGIGRAAAIMLGKDGCFVTVVGRTRETLEETVAAVHAAGGSAQSAVCDVSDENSVRAAVETAVGDRGRLDFGINSAGVSGGDDLRPTAEYTADTFDRIIGIDLRGTFLSMKYELEQMARQGFGSIVNISSGAGLVGVPGVSGYCAAKHGVMGLTKSAALDYGAAGIRVNAVAPGLVATPLVATGRSPEVMQARIGAHPIGRIAEADEIAQAVIWLCSDKASFVTGVAFPVDGGYTAR